MNKIPTLLFIFLTLCCLPESSTLFADSPLFGGESNQQILVNNRVLAHVNNKPITVLDVMKKMDMLFLKQYPEYTSSPQARFQYYQVNWKHALQELIDKELILADAEENKITISAGDVRQEMENLFGPNIIVNLDKIGLSMDEAFKIIQGDLTLRRMMGIRVNSKALRSITPQQIREAYEDFAKKNIKQDTWHYQVVTIRNNDTAAGEATANLCYEMLTSNKTTLADLNKKAKEKDGLSKSSISVSEAIYHTEADISDAIKPALKELTPGKYSKPIAQKSRTDKSTLFRILYLQEKVPGGAVTYSEIENQLQEELFDKAMSKESEAYLKKLHVHHAIPDDYIEDTIPADFQPFVIK